jgi:uncharacterized protein
MKIDLEQARGWYHEDDAVHGYGHICRVYALCQQIGKAEGVDMDILLTAALLHDAQGSHPGENSRDDHHERSAQFAGELLAQMGWLSVRIEAVQHCIRAHRFRNDQAPVSLEAQVLFDADKLDVIGAIGVVRALAYAFQDNQPAFSEPSARFLLTQEKEAGEAHSAYHEYLYKLKHISAILKTATARRIAVRRQEFLNRFFEELAAESRANPAD